MKFRKTGLSLLALAFAVLLAPQSQALPSKSEPAAVRALKKEIINLAESYRGQDDPQGTKQDKLNTKIARLLREAPQSPAQDRVSDLAGAWEQVWGPYRYGRQGRLEIDPSYVYQVVHEDGYYYNITRSEVRGKKITAFLRGEYVANGDRLDVRFTRNIFYVGGWIPNGISIYDVAVLAESGVINGPDIPVPEGQGPKGREGRLREVYVDGDLRITYGSEAGADPNVGDLYVLRRVHGGK